MDLEPDAAPDAKRARALDAVAASSIPALGEDASVWLAGRELALRHGTSLRLMAQCAEYLNESDEFNEVDPNDDWEKWAQRVPGAFTLYYAALVDPLYEGARAVQCVLRAVLDRPTQPSPPRLIIDYVTTRHTMRGQGLAGELVDFVMCVASASGSNCLVLALEESCVWWMGKGFVLEQSANLNARLRIFPDVHLLRRAADPPDDGCTDDLALAADEEEGEEVGEEEGEAADGQHAAEEAAVPEAEAAGADEDEELQEAIRASLAGASGAPGVRGGGEVIDLVESGDEGEDDDAELRAAIAMSMAPPDG